MADIALSVASKVAEFLVAPVGRQCGYVISSGSYVLQLKDELEKLGDTRDEVQHSINEAQNDMKQIKAKVENWVKEVETMTNKALNVLENDRGAKKICFNWWLPNLKARYRLGKEASKTVKDIQELISRGQFEKVDLKNPPPGLVGGAPDVNPSASDGGKTITDSRASLFQGIIEALDDEKLKVIGIYGPGGVGKTTLLEEVEKKLRKEGRPFHMIVKAKVSQTPNLMKIQYDIAYAFDLNLKDVLSEEGRRDLLFKKINSYRPEKVLIILDDLWTELDLKAVGIPLKDESMGCKLLLTSRDRRVLDQKMRADRTFHLEGLNSDEAFTLFEKTIGDKLKDSEELKAMATQVVKKLAGLPLFITSVASTLKCSDVYIWENAMIKIEDPNIENIVKWSYDRLEREDAKSLFLLCGLIGGTIEIELLVGLGMGLGLFRQFNKTIQASRNRLNAMLDILHSVCLLQDGGDNTKNVTIHDLYSEVVVSTPNFGGQNSLMMNNNYGSWPKEKLKKCWAICLADADRDRLAELLTCRFPDLKILMLYQPKDWLGMPAHQHDGEDCCRLDFTYMKELRVLYLRSMYITPLPRSMEILMNLQSLYLDHCHVEDVAILGKLKALQILSFVGSNISMLPKEIGELTNLRLLNLNGCKELQIIEPGVLKCLIHLEELYMKESFDRWMGKDEIKLESCNAKLVELKSMTKLTFLEISIRDPIIFLEDDDLPFENLIRFWINIGNVEGREFEGLRTMKLKLKGCDSILSKEWVQKTLQKTQYLHLDGLQEFKKNAHELCILGFPQLKHLDIEYNPSIKYIASSSNHLLTTFTNLESLLLVNLTDMEKICHGHVALECFGKLNDISVTRCNRLKNLWCLSERQRLVQLEKIKVWECDSMQAIVIDDAGEDKVAANDIVELPNVRHLELYELPNMTSFCTRAEGAPIQVSLPRLESLAMFGLLGLEKILYSGPSIKYSNLKSLRMVRSHFMSSILKLDWVLKLPNLESMTIESSPSAEVVFDLEDLKVAGNAEILSRLTKLELWNLPNLRHIWKQDVPLQGISRFRSLESLQVYNTGLSFLFPVSVAKCLGEIRVIRVRNCPNMEAVIVDDEGRDEGTDDIIEFSLLKELIIWDCPMEKFFSYPHEKESVATASNSRDAYCDSFFNQKVSLPSLEKLELGSTGSFKRIWHGELPRGSFCELAILNLGNCSKLLSVFHSTIIARLHNLINVKIENCPSLESLFDSGSLDATTEQTTVLLPKLEEVTVREARKPRYTMNSDSQMILGFPSLKDMRVFNCSNLRYLFPNYMAATLVKLESLYIGRCEQMKEVVPMEEGGRSKADVMSFPSLTNLTIWQCHNFEAFIQNPTVAKRQLGETIEENDESSQPLFNEMATFPNIAHLEIEGLRCKELWNNQIPSDSFYKLETLDLVNCDNLQLIAPSHMWKRLQRCLQVLQVISCRSIEIIYEGDGTDTGSGKLRMLILRFLENLRHIWQSNGLPFPNLTYVEVVGCSRLEMLFATSTAEFLGQIKELLVESCEDMKLIAGPEEGEEVTGTTITFSKLTALRLFDLPKLRRFPGSLENSWEFPSLKVSSMARCGEEKDQRFGHWESYPLRCREFGVVKTVGLLETFLKICVRESA